MLQALLIGNTFFCLKNYHFFKFERILVELAKQQSQCYLLKLGKDEFCEVGNSERCEVSGGPNTGSGASRARGAAVGLQRIEGHFRPSRK